MKRFKRILATAIALCLTLPLLPTTAFAAGSAEMQTGMGIGTLKVNTSDATTVYFGKDASGSPIAWRVIGYDGTGVASEDDTMTLLAKEGIVKTKFNSSTDSNAYDISELKGTIEGIAGGISTEEKAAIVSRKLEVGAYSGDPANYCDGVAGTAVADALLWPLSTREADGVNKAIRALGNEYDYSYYWWLRSPGANYDFAACVVGNGWLDSYGYYVRSNSNIFAVRPAFWLDLSSVLFSSAAEGGKSDALGVFDDWTTATPTELKLTISDNARTGFTANVGGGTTAAVAQGGSVSIGYSGAQTGTNEYVSAVIKDSTDKILYYGKLANNSASDTATITIPAEIAVGDYTLSVFNEQCNGDKKTDISSAFVNITLKVKAPAPATGKVYFGQTEGGAPALYRVVATSGTDMTLFYDGVNIVAGTKRYDSSQHKKWIGSALCAWLNGNDFLNNSNIFSDAERIAMVSQYSTTEESGYNAGDTFTPNQTIVLPSVAEVEDGGTWGMDATSRSNGGDANYWWLRSPGFYNFGAACVAGGGAVDSLGLDVGTSHAVRPAFKLKLSSVLFSSAATGGKLGNLGEFKSVSAAASVNLKLTILDDTNLKLGTATATAAATGNQATITYTGATPNKALSAIITDNSGTVLQYAKLVATTTADGTAPMTLPAGFNANTMKLKVFVEEANGDNLTDYASKPVEVTVTNVTPPIPPAQLDPPAPPEPPTPPAPPPSYIGESFVDNRTTFEKVVDNTISDINLAKPGTRLTLDMRGNPTLPSKLLNALAGKDVTLTLDMGGGVKWVIRGTDLSRSDYGSLNLSVNAKANTIPVTVINKVTGEVKVMQLALTHNGAFGFTMTMLLETGKENAGLWANLYYYNPATKALEYRTSGLIDVAGKAAIPFYSASDYAVVIDKRNHGAPAFTDTANHWAKNSIDFVTGRGLLTGTTKTTFSPGNVMTKQMLVTALGRLSRIDTTKYKNTKFTDVAATANYAPYVAWAVEKGIITGTTDTTFSPDKSITRQELATLMANYAKSTKCTLPQTRADAAFEDGGTIASWAAEAAINTQMAGIMNGKNGNKFDPAGTATRAEVAAVLHRYVELVIDPATAQGLDVNDSGSTMLYEKGKLVKSTTCTVGSAIYSFNAYGEAASIPHS